MIPYYLNLFLIFAVCYSGKTHDFFSIRYFIWRSDQFLPPIFRLFYPSYFFLFRHMCWIHTLHDAYGCLYMCDKRTDRYVWEVRQEGDDGFVSRFVFRVNFHSITKTFYQTIEPVVSFQERYQEIDNLWRIFWRLQTGY